MAVTSSGTPCHGPAMTRQAFNRRLIAPMILGTILSPLNSSIIAVALVPIGIAVGGSPAQTAWLVSALYLATAIGQPVAGRLIDAYGPRRLFLAGTALTGLASLLGILTPNLWLLVAARAILGLGTCAGYPAAMHLIGDENRRTGQESPAAVLTTLAVASQTISLVGPTLGGLLLGVGGWRATFAVNIPLAAAGLALGLRCLPPDSTAPRGRLAARVDLAGIASFALALLALLVFLLSPQAGRFPLLLVALAAAAAFTWRERRAPEPFIDLRVLSGRLPLLATYLRTLLAQVVSYSFLFGYGQWLESGRGLSATRSGLLLLPMFATAIVVSAVTGRSAAIRGKLLVGAVTQAAAAVALLTVSSTAGAATLAGLGVLQGIPQGLINLANQNAVYYQAAPGRVASSAGLMRTFSYLGAIGSSAATGAFFTVTADTAGLHELAVFMIAATALLVVLTAGDRSLGRATGPAAGPDALDES
jgi:MFS family permease